MTRFGVIALVVAAACSSPAVDPVQARCAPHRKLELACGTDEDRKAFVIVGDMCQKILNGKNRQFFGPAAERTMEGELACAVASKDDCAAYAACKSKLAE